MIIELFGPPGAGKTTFVWALAARLRERGHTVDLFLSHRPAEPHAPEARAASNPHSRQSLPTIRRLTRPFGEVLTMARHPLTLSHDVRTALNLVRIMPPSDILWRFRLAQYLSRLSRTWFQATVADHIVLFDQAFVQAVCSLAMLCGTSNERLISQALDEIPKSDLQVLVNAPPDVVETRLRDRERRAGRMERLLELDLATSLKSLAIVDSIERILHNKGGRIAHAASLDHHSLQEAVDGIEKLIAAQYNTANRKLVTSDSFRADRRLETFEQPLVGKG
jgi:thymidylate kinase